MSGRKQQNTDNRPINAIMNLKSNEDLRSYLEQRPEFNLSLMRDKSGSTLLHFAAFKDELSKLKIYVLHFEAFAREHMKQSRSDPSFENQLRAWINVENKDGLTALHFATIHGNIPMIEFLEQYGANMQATTREQQDLLLLATQNEQLKTVIFLLEHRPGKVPFSPNRPNQRGDTALHKAATAGFAGLAAYLLSLPETDRDAANNEGWTPLMGAVSGGHKDVTKRLLLKGADRHLKNSEGETAIDLARSQGRQDIVRILNDQFTTFQKLKICCNVKIVYRVEQPTRSYSAAFLLLFHLLFLPSQALARIEVFDSPYYFYAAAGLFYLLTLIVFGLLTGKHPRKAGGELLEAQLPLCAECRESIRANEFHCFTCGVCVWRYDHHCPWINNCVSVYNLGKFTLFLLLLILAAAEVLFLSLSLQTKALPGILPNDLLPLPADTLATLILVNLVLCGSLSLVSCIMLFSVLGEQLKNLFTNSTAYERAKNIRKKKDSLLTANDRSLNEEQDLRENGEVEAEDEEDQAGCFTNCSSILSEKYTTR